MTKKKIIQKSDNEIGKFWNRKNSTYRQTGPLCMPNFAKKSWTVFNFRIADAAGNEVLIPKYTAFVLVTSGRNKSIIGL